MADIYDGMPPMPRIETVGDHVKALQEEAAGYRRALVEAHHWISGAKGYPETVRATEACRIISKALGGVIA